jgi:hypothetical protein
MKLQGKFHEITNLAGFVSSYIADKNHPTPATFKAFPNLRVFLATDFPLGFTSSFIPGVSVNTDADANGAFIINVPDALPKTAHAYLLAMRLVTKLPPFNVPIFAPVYRSATFTVSQIDNKVHDIFVDRTQSPDSQGFTQEQISAQVASIAKAQKMDSLSAFIGEHGIGVTGKGKGATVKFEIRLSPATVPDLNAFISDSVDDFDIDLPGPDWLTGLCVSKDDIKASIRGSVGNMLPGLNKQIKGATVDAMVAQTKLPKATVTAFFDTQMSMTFDQIRFPVVGQKDLGFIKVKFRNVVADPDFGFPRSLF